MLQVFASVILPVFFVFSIGFIGQKLLKLEIKPISTMTIYLMMPMLVFKTFYNVTLDTQYLNMVIFALSLLFSIVILLSIISKIRKYPSPIKNGLILATGFMNAGNYGAPVILFTFGDEGFKYAISFIVIQSIFMNSLGVYYAAKGNANAKTALYSVLKIPSIYAFILALIWNQFHLPIPESFIGVIDLVANATIPTTMIVLGMQLAQIRIRKMKWGKVSVGVIVRLIISPILAFLITGFLPFNPLLRNVLIVLSAMPSAATTTMLSLKFDTEPELVSSTTLISTLLSTVTLSILLTLVK